MYEVTACIKISRAYATHNLWQPAAECLEIIHHLINFSNLSLMAVVELIARDIPELRLILGSVSIFSSHIFVLRALIHTKITPLLNLALNLSLNGFYQPSGGSFSCSWWKIEPLYFFKADGTQKSTIHHVE